MVNYIFKLIKKYETFLIYIFVAGISFGIDIIFFTVFNKFFNNIIIATILARIISSFINYILNRDKVFKSTESKIKTIIKYYILVVIQMCISACVVNKLYEIININATLIKVPIEFILFICNYIIQKLLIFNRGKNENNKE